MERGLIWSDRVCQFYNVETAYATLSVGLVANSEWIRSRDVPWSVRGLRTFARGIAPFIACAVSVASANRVRGVTRSGAHRGSCLQSRHPCRVRRVCHSCSRANRGARPTASTFRADRDVGYGGRLPTDRRSRDSRGRGADLLARAAGPVRRVRDSWSKRFRARARVSLVHQLQSRDAPVRHRRDLLELYGQGHAHRAYRLDRARLEHSHSIELYR